MEIIQGPALLCYNNNIFKEKDFKSLMSLGDSVKREDVTKIGKYGIGFNR
jgi:cytochrome b subunit of formate dehydrogenase